VTITRTLIASVLALGVGAMLMPTGQVSKPDEVTKRSAAAVPSCLDMVGTSTPTLCE
jgi:hypothetical protein